MRTMTIARCKFCGEEFAIKPSDIRRGRRFCSVNCSERGMRSEWHDVEIQRERFFSRVDKNGPIIRPELGPCWVWTACRAPSGYGSLSFLGRDTRAPRVAWFLEHGRWPNLYALHKCDNPPCVRIDHLFEGTKKDNARDMLAKGRASSGEQHGALIRNSHRPNLKLSAEAVHEIRALLAEGLRHAEIATRFGVHESLISLIHRGKVWAHVA